jgi:hypothetical protein
LKWHQKDQKPKREGNRYARAARVLAKDDKIDVRELADKGVHVRDDGGALRRSLARVCVQALIEVGRLPDPAKKKPAPKAKATAKPAAAETPAESAAT